MQILPENAMAAPVRDYLSPIVVGGVIFCG